MRTSAHLPLVSCRLGLSDGIVDIASFRVGATSADWTNDEMHAAIVKAVYQSAHIDDVGKELSQSCTDESRR